MKPKFIQDDEFREVDEKGNTKVPTTTTTRNIRKRNIVLGEDEEAIGLLCDEENVDLKK